MVGRPTTNPSLALVTALLLVPIIAVAASPPTIAATVLIDIHESTSPYTPNNVTLRYGDTVTWTNRASNTHGVTLLSHNIDNLIAPGGSLSRQLGPPGGYLRYTDPVSNGIGNLVLLSGADADNDGIDAVFDCDDEDANAYPGAPETPDDGVDQDCNGFDSSLIDTVGPGVRAFYFDRHEIRPRDTVRITFSVADASAIHSVRFTFTGKTTGATEVAERQFTPFATPGTYEISYVSTPFTIPDVYELTAISGRDKFNNLGLTSMDIFLPEELEIRVESAALVEIRSSSTAHYVPGTVSGRVGDPITWHNILSTTHGVTSLQQGIDNLIAPGKHFSANLRQAGTYQYTDPVNPSATPGTLVVSENPRACFSVQMTGGQVTAGASCSISARGITNFQWNWGDGSASGSGSVASHAYVACPVSVFSLRLSVTDSSGATDTSSRALAVRDLDGDGDGLAGCLEAVQGTRDDNPDTDGDGLSDWIESEWYPNRAETFCDAQCAFPQPLAKDIYVEIDWMVKPPTPDTSFCVPFTNRCVVIPGDPGYSTRPSLESMDMVAGAFEARGIEIHFDDGQYGGGNEIPFQNQLQFGPQDGRVDFYDFKRGGEGFPSYFETPLRYGIWHYLISGRSYSEFPDSTGAAIAGDDDFFVSNGLIREGRKGVSKTTLDMAVAGTIIHELGHNLCLTRPTPDGNERYPGQDSSCRYHGIDSEGPATYRSSMNYRYQDDTSPDYSTGDNDAIDDHDDWTAVGLGMADFASSVQGDSEHGKHSQNYSPDFLKLLHDDTFDE